MQNNLFFLHLSSETDPSVGPISILKKSEENEVEARADLDGKIINYVTFMPNKKIFSNVICKHQYWTKRHMSETFRGTVAFREISGKFILFIYFLYIYINFHHYNLWIGNEMTSKLLFRHNASTGCTTVWSAENEKDSSSSVIAIFLIHSYIRYGAQADSYVD